jgi:glycerol-1-phosphatase
VLVSLSPAVRPYDHVLLDLDGCVWVGDAAVPGSPEAIGALKAEGRSVLFLTNDVRHTPEEQVRRLWRLGIRAALDEVLTAGAALQFWLASRGQGGAAYVIGSQAVVDHVAEAGLRVVNRTEFATRADVVVVAGHSGFDYEELKVAAQAVLRGAELVGTSRDGSFPMGDGPWPGTGAVLAAVEAAASRRADHVVGKPDGAMYAAARDRLGTGRVLAVGDRLDSDVLGAHRAGLDSALVLSGATSGEAAEAAEIRPTHVAASLGALVLGA